MSSLPVNINHGTPASFTSALASYRRSQFMMANFIEEPQSDSPSSPESDPEACIIPVDLTEAFDDGVSTPSSTRSLRSEDGFVDELQWDDIVSPVQNLNSYQWNDPVIAPARPPALPITPARPPALPIAPAFPPALPIPQERTPLIRKTNSFHVPTTRKGYDSIEGKKNTKTRTKPPRKIRPLEPTQKIQEVAVVKHYPVGRSTFGQTLFNSIAMLLGIGMLSEPLAFAYAGWGWGTALLIIYSLLTCYTAKILARLIISDPTVRTYSDIGRKAFGSKSTHFVSLVFCLELFTVTVALVTLYADSLETIAPVYSSNIYKVLGLIVFIPTVFVPLPWLSVASILGIFSSILLVTVILIDGLTKTTAPGSIWDPEPTNIGMASFPKLGVSFGLFMAGFSGHAGIPTFARDMIDPTQFDRMIDIAYIITTVIYGAIGMAGYCMFGNNVSEEFSQDLFETPGYNRSLNKFVLCALIITPMTKFGLASHPMNTIVEHTLGLSPNSRHDQGADDQIQCQTTFKRFGVVIQRTLMAVMAVAISIAIPEFSSMMGILGSLFSFLICVIGPVSAKIAIEKKCSKLDGSILLIGIAMASWGTFSVWYIG